jgi:transcriptional regulator with XRE-family HTH domain
MLTAFTWTSSLELSDISVSFPHGSILPPNGSNYSRHIRICQLQIIILLLAFITFCGIMLIMGSEEFTKWLGHEVEHRGWTFRELGRRAGLSSGAISKVMTGITDPTWEFCAKVAEAMEMSSVDVFRQAGLLPPIPESRRREFERITDILSTLPEGPIYDETTAAIVAIVESARRRSLEREAEEPDV